MAVAPRIAPVGGSTSGSTTSRRNGRRSTELTHKLSDLCFEFGRDRLAVGFLRFSPSNAEPRHIATAATAASTASTATGILSPDFTEIKHAQVNTSLLALGTKCKRIGGSEEPWQQRKLQLRLPSDVTPSAFIPS
jgi:hypothetical protein